MTKLSKSILKQYYLSIGILLSELIIFSTPLRFPVLLFIQNLLRHSTLKVAFFSTLALALYLIFVGISRETLLLSLILLASFVFVFSRNQGINFGIISTKILIFLFLISVIQVTFGVEFGNWFSDYQDKFVGKASGFSAEPSFFSWVFIYFWLARYCVKGLDLFSLAALISALVLINAFTIVGFIMLFLTVCILLKFIKGKISALLVLAFLYHAIPFILVYFEFPIFDYALFWTGSWREPSHFASVSVGQLIGPFSGGTSWTSNLSTGLDNIYLQRFPFWIEWPWSFLSILLLEFGYLITICICVFLIWKSSINRINNYRHNVAWLLFIFIALFTAPKWMVFYFFFPFSDKTDT